jgi:hypothetical protein
VVAARPLITVREPQCDSSGFAASRAGTRGV